MESLLYRQAYKPLFKFDPMLILVLDFNLCLSTMFSCKVRDHIANDSKCISLCHMMLLMALSSSNVFYPDRCTSTLQMRKKMRQESNVNKES
jgi:hypothetical protein